MSERFYSPGDLEAVYTRHVIVEVETLGGMRHIGDVEIALEHDERLFACRGRVISFGKEAATEFWQAASGPAYPYFDGWEILYEPKSDSLVVPARFSTTGRPLVVVSIGDVLAIVRRPGAQGAEPDGRGQLAS